MKSSVIFFILIEGGIAYISTFLGALSMKLATATRTEAALASKTNKLSIKNTNKKT